MRLDEIKTHPIEVLKADLLAKGKSRKRVNDVLACLGKMLRYAYEAHAPGRAHRTGNVSGR